MSRMGISTLVVSDLDGFLKMKDFWDRELCDRVVDPFFSGCMLVEHWRLGLKVGWRPFLVVFLCEGRIVGFASLAMRSRFGFREVCNLNPYASPVFFVDELRGVCIGLLVDFLFDRLNCESVDLTFEGGSDNLRVLEMVCGVRGFKFSSLPFEGRAVIPVLSDFEVFQRSLSSQTRKSFRKASRRLDGLGSWKIISAKVDCSSVKRIWEVERYSWKRSLKGKDRAVNDFDLSHVLRAVENNNEIFFESKVWFLELDGLPIAYQLVLKHNKTAFFMKTSFDKRFKRISPGKFLINELIKHVFMEQSVERIDFVSNQPFVKVWNPLMVDRTQIRIKRSPFASKVKGLLLENLVFRRFTSFLEVLKWKKLYS